MTTEVLLNWSYHQDCPDDSFNCFMTEVTSMLTERVQYVAWMPAVPGQAAALRRNALNATQVARSRENVLKWKAA